MEGAKVIDNIRQVATKVLPKGSELYLYGSRARGDAHTDSDWDLLILLSQQQLDYHERDDLIWAFEERGFDIGEDISARAYTKEQWHNGPHSMFYFNVETDKKLIYES